MTDATLMGADVDEGTFQGLYDTGAFDPDLKPPQDAPESPPSDAKVDDDAPPPPGDENELQDADKDADKPKEGEKEEPAYTDLDDFLTKNELDAQTFKALPVRVKIDGVEKTIPLTDVIKSYQLEGHVNNKSVELSEQRRSFEQEANAARELAKQQLLRNESYGQAAQALLNREFQAIDWNGLRAANPAEYAARFAEFQQRQGEVNNYVQGIEQQRQQEATAMQTQVQERLKQEQQNLYEARPEWRDVATFAKAKEQVIGYAKGRGFTDAELSQIGDHRVLLALHDAARFGELQASKPATLKAVRQAPKMAAPGARVNANPQDAAKKAAFDRFNQNPNDMDAQASAFEFLVS